MAGSNAYHTSYPQATAPPPTAGLAIRATRHQLCLYDMDTCSEILIGSIHLLGRARTLRLLLLCTQRLRLSGTVAPLQLPVTPWPVKCR